MAGCGCEKSKKHKHSKDIVYVTVLKDKHHKKHPKKHHKKSKGCGCDGHKKVVHYDKNPGKDIGGCCKCNNGSYWDCDVCNGADIE